MANDQAIIEYIEDALSLADEPRDTYLEDSIHAHFLFNNTIQRWIPGTEEPIEVNDGHPVSIENMIQPMLLDAVSLLLKNYHMFRIKPAKPSDYDLADEINKHILAIWDESEVQTVLQLSQLEAFITGMSIIEVYPEGDQLNNISTYIGLVPREDIWFNPKEIDIKRSWAIRRTWHTLRELELEWGEDIINDAIETPEQYDWDVSKESGEIPDWWEAQDDLYPLFTLWLPSRDYDPDMLEEDEIAESPFGRKVEVLQQTILRNAPNPFAMPMSDPMTGEPIYIGHKSHPYVLHECNRVVGENGYTGLYDVKGLVNAMESSQWELNELTRVLMQLGRRVAQPPILAPEGSLVDPTSNVSYTAGKVIQYDPAISPTPPSPVPMPADAGYVQYLHQQRKSSLREISGVREMMTGSGPSPGTSHTPVGTIASAQEASFTRMWTVVSALDRAITGVGIKMLGIMQEFFPVGKYNAVSVNGEQWHGEWQQRHIDTEFRLEVISGMSTPLRDMDRVSTATQIFSAISPILQMGESPQALPMLTLVKAYLQTINEPAAWEYLNVVSTMVDNIEQRQQEQEMMQMQQMQQMQGMQQGMEGLSPEEQALAEAAAMNNGGMIPGGDIEPTEEAQLPPTLPIQ